MDLEKVEIDIPRATSENRKILFSHANKFMLYYTTAFGEMFAIPVWRAYNKDIFRTSLASEFIDDMEYHNLHLNDGGND